MAVFRHASRGVTARNFWLWYCIVLYCISSRAMKNFTVTLSLENKKKVIWKKSGILSTKKCTNPVLLNSFHLIGPVLGSFAVQFGDHLRYWDHLRAGIICGTSIFSVGPSSE